MKKDIDVGIPGRYQKREEFDTIKENINAEQQPNTHSKSLDLGADNVVQDQYQIYFLQNSVKEIPQEIVNPTFNQNIENTEQTLGTFKANKINKTNESFQDDGYVTMAEIQEERKKALQSKTSSEKSGYLNMDGCKTSNQPKYANHHFFRNNTSGNIVTDNDVIVTSETALSSKL